MDQIEKRAQRERTRRRRNLAAGRCRCGRPKKARRKRCEGCLHSHGKWGYRKRYGVEPAMKCLTCADLPPTKYGPRLRVAWALPGSDRCARHQGWPASGARA